jgi:predicted ATPase
MEEKPYLRSISLKRETVPSFAAYPFSIPAVCKLESMDFHADVTFLVGENGSGKSTLLEALALTLGFCPEGGTRNVRLQTANDQSPLHQHLRLVRSHGRPKDYYYLRAESFYNVATYMDTMEVLDGKSLHGRSHGEAFLTVLTHKLHGQGLYLFDEPEAALSPTRQLAALRAIHQLVENGSQFIIATHSPILLAYPKAKIIQLDQQGVSTVKYEETEHFLTTKNFLNNYQGLLHHLLRDETKPPPDTP